MYKKSSENFVHEANYNYLSDVNFLFISFSLNDAIDFFINTKDNSDIESYSDEHAHDLAMMPAIEKENSERQSHLVMRSKLCFLMTWFCLWKVRPTFMQCNMVKVIRTIGRMKMGLLLHFYCCQGVRKVHIEIFIEQMPLTHTMKQSHVQWAEIDFER